MSEHITNDHINHDHGYGHYILIWFALLILTGLTVAVAGIDFGNLTIITALAIASLKSFLVLKVFMHLEVEKRVFTVFVSLILLFSDYSFLQG